VKTGAAFGPSFLFAGRFMKIGEKFIDGEGDTFHVQKTFDPNPTLESARQARDRAEGQTGEYRHVGRFPAWLIEMWCKEAGVRPDDVQARQEVMRKKIMSGEFSAFRNWEGSF
jgi:hypothetical protein